MEEVSPDSEPDIFDLALSGQAPGVGQIHIEGKTLSGRPYKYEFRSYAIRLGLTPNAALRLATRIVKAKYRVSEWDRRHPKIDVELELVFVFTSIILGVVARLAGLEPIKPQWITSWGVAFDGDLVEVYSGDAKASAERRVTELAARDGDRYSLRPITRIGFPPSSSQ